ncbi:hypothetical protein HXX01_05130 [Candidatus Nomurabacteria bacterium]|nr:hypothetical protein [Candidatus Nomurabacteria bacterium]
MRYPGGERPAIHTYKRTTLQPNDYRVISALKHLEAYNEYMPIKQIEIAALTGMQQSRVSVTIDRLCFKGIVSRFRFSYKQDALKLLKYSPVWEYAINRLTPLKIA